VISLRSGRNRLILCLFLLLFFLVDTALADRILIYMDLAQTDHLKAYGVAYWTLEQGQDVEWLLNYRGGSFMAGYNPAIVKLCKRRGVSYSIISNVEAASIYAEIEEGNMNNILLEKAPKIAIYTPPNKEPWDDAVTLALTYAEIPYETLWDKEVLQGKLHNYDWLHCHHEDFTGQFGKFYGSYRNAIWYQQEVATNQKMAQELGFAKVSELKKAVARAIKQYVHDGGFIFMMCAATDTYDIGLAAEDADIVDVPFDGDPPDPDYQEKLDYSKSFAFKDFKLITNPYVYEFSDIDCTPSLPWERPDNIAYFTLFDFSAKFDPVPTMLVQDHVNVVKDFLGQTTAFKKDLIKRNVVILGEFEGAGVVKYLHGNYGRGTFTYLGGHDPEDYQHFVGDPPTDLSLFKNSPGYRLILNNVLFPAAKKKKLKT